MPRPPTTPTQVPSPEVPEHAPGIAQLRAELLERLRPLLCALVLVWFLTLAPPPKRPALGLSPRPSSTA
jgi:hypothetical protein